MNYVARRKVLLNGHQYMAGDVIASEHLPGPSKLGSLVRVGYLISSPMVGEAPVPPAVPPEEPSSPDAPSSPAESIPDLGDLKVPQIRDLLAERGLDTTGKRDELIERLTAASAQ